jgi:small subunit ribosomal protein S1
LYSNVPKWKGSSLLNTAFDRIDTQQEGMVDFQALLAEHDYVPPRRGQILEGTILEASDYELVLDVGLKRDAIVPTGDLERLNDEQRSKFWLGKTIRAEVLRPYTQNGDLLVSVNKVLQLEDWERADELMAKGETFEAKVIDLNKGGALVQFGRLRGFVPNSHILRIRHSTPPNQRDTVKREMIDDTLQLKLLEVDRLQNRLVMSEREAAQEARMERMQELEVGQVTTGHVVHVVNFGAFVDLGGVDGLIHVSRLSHDYVEHPREVLSIGEEVTVRIDGIDLEKGRISLNRRALLPSPWETFVEEHHTGELISGVITKVVEYGIFVSLDGGVHGLVHISSMSQLGLSHPEEMFRKGDDVLVRIIDINLERERIALSIDDVTLAEQEEWMYQRQQAADEAADSDVQEQAEAVTEDAEPVLTEETV